MNKLTYKEYLSIALILSVIAILGLLWQRPWQTFGSTVIGNEYLATTTNTQALFNNYTVIRGKTGRSATGTPTTLGTITITQTGTSPMCFYDATSTITNAEWATTTIACFAASPTVGNYIFDAQYNKGILLEFTGSPTATSRASTTITFR